VESCDHSYFRLLISCGLARRGHRRSLQAADNSRGDRSCYRPFWQPRMMEGGKEQRMMVLGERKGQPLKAQRFLPHPNRTLRHSTAGLACLFGWLFLHPASPSTSTAFPLSLAFYPSPHFPAVFVCFCCTMHFLCRMRAPPPYSPSPPSVNVWPIPRPRPLLSPFLPSSIAHTRLLSSPPHLTPPFEPPALLGLPRINRLDHHALIQRWLENSKLSYLANSTFFGLYIQIKRKKFGAVCHGVPNGNDRWSSYCAYRLGSVNILRQADNLF
jgi:hypothetical protein